MRILYKPNGIDLIWNEYSTVVYPSKNTKCRKKLLCCCRVMQIFWVNARLNEYNSFSWIHILSRSYLCIWKLKSPPEHPIYWKIDNCWEVEQNDLLKTYAFIISRPSNVGCRATNERFIWQPQWRQILFEVAIEF